MTHKPWHGVSYSRNRICITADSRNQLVLLFFFILGLTNTCQQASRKQPQTTFQGDFFVVLQNCHFTTVILFTAFLFVFVFISIFKMKQDQIYLWSTIEKSTDENTLVKTCRCIFRLFLDSVFTCFRLPFSHV